MARPSKRAINSPTSRSKRTGFREALEHLEKAIQAEPNDNRLHFTLSRVYRRLGREADADSEMQKYQKLKKSVE